MFRRRLYLKGEGGKLVWWLRGSRGLPASLMTQVHSPELRGWRALTLPASYLLTWMCAQQYAAHTQT